MSSVAGRPRPTRGEKVSGMTTRWPYLILRGTTAALALLGVAQAVLAGGFLAGHYDMLKMHLYSGVSMVTIALLQTVTVLFLRRAGGPAEVVRIGLILPVALAAQAALGATHILLLHIPIGAFMMVGLLRMMRWVWRDLPEENWAAGKEQLA
jgi:cytochrome b subunit of formate dehydrogenase